MEARQNGWIFGPKGDVAAFILPILLSLLLSALAMKDWPWPRTPQYYLYIDVLFNVNHVFSTFWYTYTSPDLWKRFGRWFVAIPVIFLFANFGLGFGLGGLYLFSFFSHFSIWHFIKQQQAWFFIAASRGSVTTLLSARIQKAALYAVTWGFVFASQSQEDCRGWFASGDLIEFPTWLYWPTIFVCGVALSAYVIDTGYQLVKRRPINWAVHLVLLSATFVWGYSRLLPQSSLTFHLIQLHHAIPYFIIGYRYFSVEWREGKKFWLPPVSFGVLIIAIYCMNFLIGKVMLGMRSGLGIFWDAPDFLDGAMDVGGFVFWNATSLTHYTLDGIIWNRKHNPNWTKALGR